MHYRQPYPGKAKPHDQDKADEKTWVGHDACDHERIRNEIQPKHEGCFYSHLAVGLLADVVRFEIATDALVQRGNKISGGCTKGYGLTGCFHYWRLKVIEKPKSKRRERLFSKENLKEVKDRS